jgi:ABC-type transport system substrate-binding protein
VLVGLVLAVAVAALPQPADVAAQANVRARIAGGAPLTWDPAHAGETGSANMLAQVFEGLTAFDWQNQIQPALAQSWTVSDDGTRIDFELRPGLRYSDGSPIRGQDFVDSWLRLLEPTDPSPLYSLLADVRGANDYLAGSVGRAGVGLSADDDTVTVELRRPAAYFLAVTGSPSLAVVPPSMWDVVDSPLLPDAMVVSGGYVPTTQTDTAIRLEANPNYWAGPPPLGVIELVTDFGGVSPVTAFEDETVDYVNIGSWDASWVRYDDTLGPQLRAVDDFVVHYYGFDTSRPPFDDARVRLAFAKAVDWERMVRLADEQPATSLVPAGIPGGGNEDYRPAFDPGAARQALADAGFASGAGFPTTALVSNGYGYEVAVAEQLEEALGITVNVELMEFSDYLGLRGTPAAPLFWTISWSADYPHAHDFLGLLLESGSSSNEGHWSNAEYDAAIEAAAATADPDEQAAFYAQAQAILREQAPIVPVSYSDSWALSRDGLLGALPSGVGYLRFAGLDWAPGSDR